MADRAARQEAGVAAYQTFIRGLLDMTDNLAAMAVAPPRTLRHDDGAILIWWSRPTRGPRRSPTSPTRSRGIRPLAWRRLRVRRLGGLRPQENGHHRARRLGGGQTPFPRDRGHDTQEPGLHGRRCRRHVRRCLRQRHAAVANISAWWRPSTICTSSSIPIPTRPTFKERSACSSCRAASWADYDEFLISKGGGDLSTGPPNRST